MQDNKLAADEARREVRHWSVKAQVEGDVNAEIAARADRTTPAEARKIEQVAGEFRGKAIDEVVVTEREVERGGALARVSRVNDYVFYAIVDRASGSTAAGRGAESAGPLYRRRLSTRTSAFWTASGNADTTHRRPHDAAPPDVATRPPAPRRHAGAGRGTGGPASADRNEQPSGGNALK